jgi:SAM-dependent methyltransferase
VSSPDPPAGSSSSRVEAGRSAFTPALAYSVLTPVYDLALEVLGFGRSFKAAVAELADVQPGEAVLDLGCGTGTLLQALLARRPDARFTGLDPDPRVLAMARRRLRRSARSAELVAGYAQDLPFPNAAFDLVVSTLTFHHLPGPVKVAALREVRRVLAPHGRFLLVDFGMPATRIAQVLLRIGSLFDGRENMRANLAGELPVMLAAAGIAVHEVSHPHRGVRHLLARPQQEQAT